MHENISNDAATSTNSTVSTNRPAGGVSRLALLASFVAGAFAAWIFIELAGDPVENSAPPASTSMSR